MYRQLRYQALERALATDQADGTLNLQCRFEYAIGNLLGEYVVDADDQAQWPLGRAVLQGFEQITTEREDLVGIAVDEAAHLGWNEPATGLRKKFFSQS